MIQKKAKNASDKSFPFTKKRLDAAMHDANARSSETEFSDADTSNLRLVVNSGGQKHYRYRGTLNGQKWTERIGAYLTTTLQEARRTAREWKGLLDDGIDPKTLLGKNKPASITFDDFVTKYYIPYAVDSKRSVKDDLSKLNRHMRRAFGQLALDSISTGDIELYLRRLTNKRKGNDVPLSPASRNRHLALLSSIFNKAIDYDMATRTPCGRIKQLPENNMMTRFLTNAELERFWLACSQEKNRVIGVYLLFLLLTGARRQEGLSATWADIDLTTKNWTIPHTKAGKAREVPLNDLACQLLEGLERIPGNDHLFPGKVEGKPVNNPMKAFHRILAQAGIKGLRIHDLRHTFASLAAINGESLYHIQKLLGHASFQTTQRYAHLSNQALLQTSGRVASAVAGALPAGVLTAGAASQSDGPEDDGQEAVQDQAA